MNTELISILQGLSSNPEFIRVVGYRYSNGSNPSMANIVTALYQVKEYWEKANSSKELDIMEGAPHRA